MRILCGRYPQKPLPWVSGSCVRSRSARRLARFTPRGRLALERLPSSAHTGASVELWDMQRRGVASSNLQLVRKSYSTLPPDLPRLIRRRFFRFFPLNQLVLESNITTKARLDKRKKSKLYCCCAVFSYTQRSSLS